MNRPDFKNMVLFCGDSLTDVHFPARSWLLLHAL